MALLIAHKSLPGEGTVAAQPSVSAEQWLTVPKADSIVTKAASSYGTLSSDVGLEETKGSSTGDYVTLNGYDGNSLCLCFVCICKSDSSLRHLQTPSKYTAMLRIVADLTA